ncbi:MAG: hypothetical protein IPM52_07165 [Bacteroidetes bacterium]|nr:hypothetical protein [Bacteroidota bacterium]
MKTTFLLAIMLTLVMGLNAQKDDYMNLKQFDIKSGKVVYKIEGKTKGTKTLWFDDYGRYQYEHTTTTTKIFGITSKEDKLKIRDKEWIYDINLIEKTGTKMRVQDANEILNTVTNSASDAELKKFAADIQKDMEIKDGGTETILGKTCKLTISGKLNSKIWEYKRIPLKTTVELGGLGSTSEEAVSFEENISIPASQFTVPSGISLEFIDMKKMNGLMGVPDDND